ncbi:ATP-binding protein [Natronorubrum bangense]|uniref:AAA family ATPase n=1 Tax=Natronorubrum bangense TaxID=61858 RepID=A0A4D6HK45_9EURY|nr:AAA family ATPase [Natronorubrum bangense]QCC54584.1 AAA family ATPase [Natronorubrum bangense]
MHPRCPQSNPTTVLSPAPTSARDRCVILVICGPPGAGKTTIATALAERLEVRSEPVRLHHSDEFSSRTYEQLYERARADPEDALTIVDGTFYKRRWQTQFDTLEDVRFVHVTASLETCLERNRSRADPIDEQGVHVVYREFAEPDAALEIDTDDCDVETAVGRLERALEAWGWFADET